LNYEGAQALGIKPTVETIVTICDRMLSYADFVADEIVFKRFTVHPRWRAMFSGNDIGHVTPIERIVEGHLTGKPGHLEEVADSFRNAFHEHSHLLAVDSVLGKYGHTISSWRQRGLQEFGSEEFGRINQLIERVEIPVEFLVVGFSPEGQGHIFTVGQEWAREGYLRVLVRHRDVDGFSVIGTGTIAALSSLLRKPLTVLDTQDLIYRACEAKMLAEKAPGVGRGTVLSVLECQSSDPFVGERYIMPDWDLFRKILQDEGQPPVPEAAKQLLAKAYAISVDWEALKAKRTREKP
jgi:hypothetical protein